MKQQNIYHSYGVQLMNDVFSYKYFAPLVHQQKMVAIITAAVQPNMYSKIKTLNKKSSVGAK